MKSFSRIQFLLIIGFILTSVNISVGDVYSEHPNWTSSDSVFTISVAAGDMDNNGFCDLVAGNYSYPYPDEDLTVNNVGDLDISKMGGSIVIYWNDSTGISTDPDTIYSGVGVDKIVIVDIDNNDTLDILMGSFNSCHFNR